MSIYRKTLWLNLNFVFKIFAEYMLVACMKDLQQYVQYLSHSVCTYSLIKIQAYFSARIEGYK